MIVIPIYARNEILSLLAGGKNIQENKVFWGTGRGGFYQAPGFFYCLSAPNFLKMHTTLSSFQNARASKLIHRFRDLLNTVSLDTEEDDCQ
jgi:hypothetical protein